MSMGEFAVLVVKSAVSFEVVGAWLHGIVCGVGEENPHLRKEGGMDGGGKRRRRRRYKGER